MKKDIHPKYHKIFVVMTDGSKVETRSTYDKEGAELRLDIDQKTHPAWNKKSGSAVSQRNPRLARYSNRYPGLTK